MLERIHRTEATRRFAWFQLIGTINMKMHDGCHLACQVSWNEWAGFADGHEGDEMEREEKVRVKL
ncbi:uncharacterized protein ColSpa_11582 [Colletotrichum spaethianum]|uniref:Uncharacterized protein n=1 Tax=Colletotrichum spaethianum TaxID=700344 RepID=A0AA37PFL3_9PEZI|nr:uncharacterized protein ColSpa_11582 [Colletotrichum spaethianum]GKT51401.1 hypothetical protein ColSpa_11582 [Colletotrichum spaethianum]